MNKKLDPSFDPSIEENWAKFSEEGREYIKTLKFRPTNRKSWTNTHYHEGDFPPGVTDEVMCSLCGHLQTWHCVNGCVRVLETVGETRGIYCPCAIKKFDPFEDIVYAVRN